MNRSWVFHCISLARRCWHVDILVLAQPGWADRSDQLSRTATPLTSWYSIIPAQFHMVTQPDYEFDDTVRQAALYASLTCTVRLAAP
jgi:hypothetical protein